MASFSSMGQFFDDVTKLVDDLVAVECQIHAEYCDNRTVLALSSTSKPSISTIIPVKQTKTTSPTPAPLSLPHFLPMQIPLGSRGSKLKLKSSSSSRKSKAPKLSSISVSLPAASLPKTSKTPEILVARPINRRIEINPFIELVTKEVDSSSNIPLTMFSLFQIPLESELTESLPALTSEDTSEASDGDTDSSCDEESLSTSPPPPFMVFHSAAFAYSDQSHASGQLSSEFRLLYARDKIIASSEPERAYFIKYANELVSSRAANLKARIDDCPRPFRPSEYTPIVRDLYGMCPAVTQQDLLLIQDKRSSDVLRFAGYKKGRDIRPNSSGWRILASEFCMIHANKIVRPLKPRAYLPRRGAEFTRVPSKLRNCF